jgi:hypothetical protein
MFERNSLPATSRYWHSGVFGLKPESKQLCKNSCRRLPDSERAQKRNRESYHFLSFLERISHVANRVGEVGNFANGCAK